MSVRLALGLALALCAGCARTIVATPEEARAQNDIDWRIEKLPEPPSAAQDPPAPPPDAAEATPQ